MSACKTCMGCQAQEQKDFKDKDNCAMYRPCNVKNTFIDKAIDKYYQERLRK